MVNLLLFLCEFLEALSWCAYGICLGSGAGFGLLSVMPDLMSVLAIKAGCDICMQKVRWCRIVNPNYFLGSPRYCNFYFYLSLVVNACISLVVGAVTSKSSVVTPSFMVPSGVYLEKYRGPIRGVCSRVFGGDW